MMLFKSQNGHWCSFCRNPVSKTHYCEHCGLEFHKTVTEFSEGELRAWSVAVSLELKLSKLTTIFGVSNGGIIFYRRTFVDPNKAIIRFRVLEARATENEHYYWRARSEIR